MPTHVAFGLGSAIAPSGASIPVAKGAPSVAEIVTNGPSSQRTVAAAVVDGIASVVPDVDVYVNVGGPTVTASATTGWKVRANLNFYIGVAKGQHVAIINV